MWFINAKTETMDYWNQTWNNKIAAPTYAKAMVSCMVPNRLIYFGL